MQWIRYIFKIDGVASDIVSYRDILLMFILFIVLFGILDSFYALIVFLFDINADIFNALNVAKYFFIPILALLSLHIINFSHTFFLLKYKRNYQIKNYTKHYLAKTSLFKHTLYKRQDLLNVNLIREDSFQKLYDTFFMSNYKRAYIGHYHSVLEIKLPQKTPHIILSSKFNKQSHLPAYFKQAKEIKIQHLSDLFSIYVLAGSEAKDYKFLKSKKLIQTLAPLVDCDFEFIDNKLLCYAPILSQDTLGIFFDLGTNLRKVFPSLLKDYKYSPKDKHGFTMIDRIIIKNPARQTILFLISLITSIGALFYLLAISETWAIVISLIYAIINLALLIGVMRSYKVVYKLKTNKII